MQQYYSPKTAAQVLNLSSTRLQQLDNSGVLPALRTSTGYRFWPSDVVEKFKAERDARRIAKECAASAA